MKQPPEQLDPAATEWMLRYLDDALTEPELQVGAERLKNDLRFRTSAVSTLVLVTQLREIGQELKFQRAAAAPVALPESKLRTWLARATAAFRFRPAFTFALGLGLLLVGILFAAGSLARQPHLLEVDGQVWLETRAGRTLAHAGARVRNGAWITLGPQAAATVGYRGEETSFRLTEGAAIRLERVKMGKKLFLRAGVLNASVAPQGARAPLTLQTPQLSVRVIGTEFVLSAKETRTHLEVWQGNVQAASLDGTVLNVSAGQLAIAAAGAPLQIQPLQRGLLEERWRGVIGLRVEDLTSHPDFPDRPSARTYLGSFETPSRQGDSYGVRLRGWLHPFRSGEYRFWIAADDAGELWLSSDETAARKHRICYTAQHTAPYEWDEQPAQASVSVHLRAGHSYYVEALGKQAGGDDHLAVAWSGPQLSRRVITADYLAPVLAPPSNP